jgi:OOP family OmpA-OmpF porin
VEVRDELRHDLGAGLDVGVGHERLGAIVDQLPDVDLDERLLRQIELTVDVAERGQVEDDRVHLLLGDVGVVAEGQHPAIENPAGRGATQPALSSLRMRWALALGCVMVTAPRAVAEPRPRPPIDVGGFVGMDFLPRDNELGNSWAPDQVPGSGPALGGRVTWWALPRVVGGDDDLALDLGVEGELGIAATSTSSDAMAGRPSYASPIVGAGAHLIAALETGTPVRPHLVAGGGVDAMFTRSPFAGNDADPVGYWGLGIAWHLGDTLDLRVDLRHGVEAGRMGGVTSTFTAEVGLSTRLGRATPVVVEHVEEPPPPPRDVVVAPPPTPPDRDGDGIADAQDRCPDQPEDKDGFADDDGCPDPDNDGDGVLDAQDRCPSQPETRNGFQDADGCPDELPPALAAIADRGEAISFPRTKAKLQQSGKKALDQVAAALRAFPDVRLRIVSHAGRGVKADLAQRRADAVKWYLIDAGIAADRIDASAVPADANGVARIELGLTP